MRAWGYLRDLEPASHSAVLVPENAALQHPLSGVVRRKGNPFGSRRRDENIVEPEWFPTIIECIQ